MTSTTTLQIAYALAHPVFDPARQISIRHNWEYQPGVTAMLTVNIGLE
jgi:hypothetical protein